MGAANISMVSARVDGSPVPFTGSGAAGVADWTLDDAIVVSDYTSTVSVVLDFDEDHINSPGTNDPYAIVSDGNLGDLFSAYTLTMNPTTGLVTLTFDPDDYLGKDTAAFQVSGRGDDSDNVFITFVCFAEGTVIDTVNGPTKVEDLCVNDLVATQSNGNRPLRWIGSRHLAEADLQANPQLRPVRIRAGAFGNGLPATDLLVSPQHRVFVSSPNVQLLFGIDGALVPAKGLIDGKTVQVSEQNSVTYYHLLFDQHEMIRSNGAWTESFYPGKQACSSLDPSTRNEVYELFPELITDDDDFEAAAPLLSVHETRLLTGSVQRALG